MTAPRARQIVSLLRTRHSGDVFIDECKDGPTWGGGHLRLDAWSMRRSWTSPEFTAYEIKAARSDFLSDQKWVQYLDLCNAFYFVCPWGMISPAEVGTEAGLIWVASTGTRLFTKKKAPHRPCEPPVPLLLYAMMRARDFDLPHKDPDRGRDFEFWREWLAGEAEMKEIGHLVSRRLQQRIREDLASAQSENRRLAREIEGYAEVRAVLEAAKISPGEWKAGERLIAAAEAGVPDRIVRHCELLRDEINRFVRNTSKTGEAL